MRSCDCSLAEQLQHVVDFVAESFRTLLDVTPEIFPVSAREALRSKVTGDRSRWKASGFEALERFIVSTLDQTERIRLKLLNPVGGFLGLYSMASTLELQSREKQPSRQA